MTQNMSFTDREFRMFLGAGFILGAVISTPEQMGVWSWLVLASVPLITTGITGWDPLYALLGISSRSNAEQNLRQKHWSFANLGMLDRTARLGLVAAILGMVMFGESQMLAALGAIPVALTVVMAWDPFYAMAGVNTLASSADAAQAEDIPEVEISTYYDIEAANDASDAAFKHAA